MLWSVYVVRCRDGSLYTGITTDPVRRLSEHNRGCGSAYTRSRLPVALVYLEPAEDRSQALRREHAIKRMSRAEKDFLVDPRRERRPAAKRP
jgi:putative endonuclease